MYIETRLERIEIEINELKEKVDYLINALISEKQDTTELSNRTIEELKTGDAPRYCACGQALKGNKEIGVCRKCIAKSRLGALNRNIPKKGEL